MQILGKNVPGRENSMQDKGHAAGLCFACSRKYREAQLPGLRVNEGWEEGKEAESGERGSER